MAIQKVDIKGTIEETIELLGNRISLTDKHRIRLVNSKDSYIQSLINNGNTPNKAFAQWYQEIQNCITDMDETMKQILTLQKEIHKVL